MSNVVINLDYMIDMIINTNATLVFIERLIEHDDAEYVNCVYNHENITFHCKLQVCNMEHF